MKVLLFDPLSGVSGDMMLAALLDLGADREYVRRMLRVVPGTELKIGRANRQGVNACKIDFKIKKAVREGDFIPLLKRSRLPADIKKRAASIIEDIFTVEKKVHRTKHLHLHELADADTLLDITGVLAALDTLSPDRIYSKPVKAGTGFIKTMEGNMPAFNFATAYLLRKFPVHFLPVEAELTTPTGAAILARVATPCEELIISRIDSIGLGAGSRDMKEHPNVLRVFLGESYDRSTDECTVIETNIDDMNPQDYEMLFEKLYAAGALDVFLTPTIMKRSRPGILLTVLCQRNIDGILEKLFTYTTSIGFRIRSTMRVAFRRRIAKVASPYGRIAVKIIEYGGRTKFSLEYRDLKRIAERVGRSVSAVRSDMMRLLLDRSPVPKRRRRK